MAQPDSQLFIPAFLPTNRLDNDTTLIATIAKLEGLARQTNIPSFIRNGGLSTSAIAPTGLAQSRASTPHSDSAQSEASTSESEESLPDFDAMLVDKGKRICQALGILIRASYDAGWRTEVSKLVRRPSSVNGVNRKADSSSIITALVHGKTLALTGARWWRHQKRLRKAKPKCDICLLSGLQSNGSL